MQPLILRLALMAVLLFFSSYRGVKIQQAERWEGIFNLPRGDQKAQAQFDFGNSDGILTLPDLIPVPLDLTHMRKKADSVFFTIGFRSGPAACKALVSGDTMRGVMSSSRGGEFKFWLARAGAARSIFNQPKPPADQPVVIKTHKDTDKEKAVKARLEALLGTYDLEPYLYTKEIMIRTGTIPHSHPVLTLNTNFQGNDTYLLSTFLHEQMHWYTLSKAYDHEAMGKEILSMYPEVPADLPEGGGSVQSTYLHILICYLEYHTLSQVMGEEKALAHMQFMATQHYTWVYETILKDRDKLEILIKQHHLQFD